MMFFSAPFSVFVGLCLIVFLDTAQSVPEPQELSALLASLRLANLTTVLTREEGVCHENDQFVINTPGDLFTNISNLECIFAAGIPPTGIGLGYHYGGLLLAANTAALDLVSRPLYKGDYVVQTQCHGNFYHVGVFNLAGLEVGTALWTIGNLPEPVTAGEHRDNKTVLVMDFRINIKTLCDAEGVQSQLSAFGFLPFHNSLPPINQFVDVGRIVGRDARDGGLIMLNKAYASDPTLGFATVLFYYIKNFDPTISLDVTTGTVLTVPESFSWNRGGLGAVLKRLPTSVSIVKAHQHELLDDLIRAKMVQTQLQPESDLAATLLFKSISPGGIGGIGEGILQKLIHP